MLCITQQHTGTKERKLKNSYSVQHQDNTLPLIMSYSLCVHLLLYLSKTLSKVRQFQRFEGEVCNRIKNNPVSLLV